MWGEFLPETPQKPSPKIGKFPFDVLIFAQTLNQVDFNAGFQGAPGVEEHGFA